MIRSLRFLGVRTEAFAATLVTVEVDDFDAARVALVAAGASFVGEPQRDGGVAWSHDRGPDGNVYPIVGPDRSGG